MGEKKKALKLARGGNDGNCPRGEGRQARAEGAPQTFTLPPDAKTFIGVKKQAMPHASMFAGTPDSNCKVLCPGRI